MQPKEPAWTIGIEEEYLLVDKQTMELVNDPPPTIMEECKRLTTRVLLSEFTDVLMVQRGQFLDSGAGRVAYLLNEDGIAVRRPIEVGARSLGAVQIVAGLDQGDTIIISSLDPFRSADSVLLTN